MVGFYKGEEEDEDDDQEEDDGKEKTWKGDDSGVERKSDVDEGKTVFLRNLDFSTTQESLKNFMGQFGELHYALLCMDKVMERPKGTGFAKFKVISNSSVLFYLLLNIFLLILLLRTFFHVLYLFRILKMHRNVLTLQEVTIYSLMDAI